MTFGFGKNIQKRQEIFILVNFVTGNFPFNNLAKKTLRHTVQYITMKSPLILAIDTSCDETCAAVSRGRKILSSVVDSQINIHQKYGGVVPFLAKRSHEAKIDYVVKEALKRARIKNFKSVAVTIGPGLAPALEVGISYAKTFNKPIIPVNHLEGHMLSAFINIPPRGGMFPALGLIVSGGHTELVLVKKIGQYRMLGQTLDDAAGEALDKLAKMLKLGYPGGPIIEELAKKGNPDAVKLPIPMQHSNDLNFSFSGLKTAALYQIKSVGTVPTEKFIDDMCAGFQKAISISLTAKLKKAIMQYQPKSLLLGGGVFSNLYLRHAIKKAVKIPIFYPKQKKYFTDNAAMIAVAASFYQGQTFGKNLDRQPNLNFLV